MNDVNQTPQKTSKAGLWVGILVVIVIIAAGAWYFLGQEDETITNNANVSVNSVSNANAATNAVVNENVNSVANTNVSLNANIDTTDWQTYTDDQYGFTFKYPADSAINREGNQLTVYDADHRDQIVLVIIEGGIQEVIDSINAIPDYQVIDFNEVNLNGQGGYVIKLKQTAANKSHTDIAVDLSNRYFVRLTPYELDPVSGFPATLESQDIIYGIVNSISIL